jgi:beta-lactamase regulating signal transducer with metallopeptidase domain
MLAFVNHLWQSTMFLGVAGLLALVLRNNSARTRYWVWFASSVKFLLPFSLLVALGHRLSWVRAPLPGISLSSAVLHAVRPLAMQAPNVRFAAVISAHLPQDLAWVVSAIWAVGACGLIVYWVIQWNRLSDKVRAAMPIQLGLPISVRVSRSLPEPGIVGIFNPILLLPEGIADHLTPAQLQAVLAHELAHVRCHDNLTGMIHMAVEAIFWFYPPVWWLSHRLLRERERACDEAALLSGGDPADYAEGIISVCRVYLASPLRCAAGVGGASLANRIVDIMSYSVAERLSYKKKLVLFVTGSSTITVPILMGLLLAESVRAQPGVGPSAKPVAGMDWLTTTSGDPPEWDVTASKIEVGATVLDPMHAENLRLSHGNARIQADSGEVINLPGQGGQPPIIDWKFAGHVRIEFAGGELQAEAVTAQFNGFHVTITTPNGDVIVSDVNGTPGSTQEVRGGLTLTLVATKDNLDMGPGIIIVEPPVLPPSPLTYRPAR